MLRKILLLASVCCLAPAMVHAQGTTTASLEGVVVDAQTGEGLPGATVVAVHLPSGTEYGTAARSDGRYDLRGLRVGGPYTVTASFIGFQSVIQTDVQLTLATATYIRFELLEDVALLDGVEIIAEGVGEISRSRTGASTNISSQQIESLPSLNRSLADFARLSPLSAGLGSSSVAGRNNRFNNISVDGATLNDVFGLSGAGTPGGQAGTQPISLDAVEAFNVDIAPFDVRYSGFTGGSINAVTRSGTNNFRGSFRFQGRNQDLVGNFRGQPFGDFSEYLAAGAVGGPIIQNQLFFFANAEVIRNRFPNTVGVLGSGAANVFPVAAETLNQIRQIAQNTYGYDPGGFEPFSDSRDNEKFLIKLDWNASSRHRLSVRHNYVNARDDSGINRGVGSFSLENRRWVFRSMQNSSTAQLFSNFANNITNEARLVLTTIRDKRDVEADPFPQVQIRLPENRNLFMGIDRFSQANELDQDLIELTNNLTLFRGDHTITFGTSNQVFRFRNLFIRDFYGAYEFDAFSQDGVNYTAIQAFEMGRPSRYFFSYASNYDFDDQGRLRVDSQNRPLRTVEAGDRPEATFTAAQFGLYAQNEWDVMPNLRLTGGLRLDIPVFPDRPLNNPLVSGTTAVRADGTPVELGPAFRREAYEQFAASRTSPTGLSRDVEFQDYSDLRTDHTATGNLLFSPRLGFNYSTTGLAGRTLQVRGGTGLFAGSAPFVWISNQFSNTGVDVARVDTGALPIGSFPGTANPADHPRPGVTPGLAPVQTTEINLIDRNFRLPQVWRSSVGFDQELPFGFLFTTEGIYSNTVNDVAYQNLNRVEIGIAADGRPLYGVPGNSGQPTRLNPAFTDALYITNTGSGYEWSVYTQLQRRVAQGFGGSLSYTLNRSVSTNPLTSSQAISNWQNNRAFDTNNAELGTSPFERRHRFLAYGGYTSPVYLDRLNTTLNIILESQSGEPVSWVYNGDANGDGNRFNSLLFVPRTQNDIFLLSNNWAQLDAFIRGEPGLERYRGQVVPRGSSNNPWRSRIDLELKQGVQTLVGQRVELEMTLLNVLNFLNDDWGRTRFSSFDNIDIVQFERYINPSDVGNRIAGRIVTADDLGRPVVSFNEFRVNDILSGELYPLRDFQSRWQLRFGVRYIF